MDVPPGPLPIPQPPTSPLLGNLGQLERQHPIESLMRLAQQYGPIFHLSRPGAAHPLTVVSGLSLVDEVCDDARFDKVVQGGERGVRSLGGDGLFTAYTHEPNWRKAHRILLPNFSQRAMQAYLPQMLEVTGQLVDRWARLNPGEAVDVAADMTRLTLETIGLCGFGYRFHSFERETPHPFVAAMTRSLETAQRRVSELPLQARLHGRQEHQFTEDLAAMEALVDGVIRQRRLAGGGPRDLLQCMLEGVDPESGEGLDDVNIRSQVITFLIAGHETTSSLLSFALYFLVKHPAVLAKARDEVDRVLGADPAQPPSFAAVHQLRYVAQVLDESLRLWPTAPAFSRSPGEDVLLGGHYLVPKGAQVMILTPALHRQREVWGEDAESFDPERFRPEARAALPANAFKPFGHGQRACIGRQFALQEAALALGLILQRFELIDHLDYRLEIKQTLTIKPGGFSLQVRPRPGLAAPVGRPAAWSAAPADGRLPEGQEAPDEPLAGPARHGMPLLVLYGSNLGTAEGLAGEIARDGLRRGFRARTAPLDAMAAEPLPTEGALVVVTASYNGRPPDNAVAFCARLEAPPADGAFGGVRFCVFGCGNRDWAGTYQAIPQLVDRALEAGGARRFYERGEGDARDDFDGQFRAWYGPFWEALASACGLGSGVSAGPAAAVPRVEAEVVPTPLAVAARASFQAVALAVRSRRELQRQDGPRPSARSTVHLEIALPPGMTYRTGDHLGVLPRNGAATALRVLRRYGLDAGAYVRLRAAGDVPAHLPLGAPVPLLDLLVNVVELQDVATRAQIEALAACAAVPEERAALRALAGTGPEESARYREAVLAQRRSVLDLLEEYPSCTPPLGQLLAMLPPLRPRYYSISSSPQASGAPLTCSITVGVVEGPARSGRGVFHGVCSTHLATREPGASVMAFVRSPTQPFHPPADPRRPMILVGPGTGLAPFRGFLQERRAQRLAGAAVGEALLFFGCRDPEQDLLYGDELRAFEAEGLVRLHLSYSRLPGQPREYVQERIRREGAEVCRLLRDGAAVYVCGDASRMAPEVRAAFSAAWREGSGGTEAEALAYLAELQGSDRYLEDIWGGA